MDSVETSGFDAQRFARQERLSGWGAVGQERLSSARVAIVGTGALGGAAAQWLVRAGVGRLHLIDRDVVEPSNLPRQVLFDAEDARQRRPKVAAAASALGRIGGPTQLEEHALHLDARFLRRLGRNVDLWIDGTDNPATRYLLNDYAIKHGKPWVYAGVVGTHGVVLPVAPEIPGPCLRCLFPEPPEAGLLPTCDSAGVLGPAVGAVAALQAGWALRYLTCEPDQRRHLPAQWSEVDPWQGQARTRSLPSDPACTACVARQFEFLDGAGAEVPEILCGRNAVQLPARPSAVDLDALQSRLAASAAHGVERTEHLLRFDAEDLRISVFADGRALVEGTEDPGRARQVGDRWLT